MDVSSDLQRRTLRTALRAADSYGLLLVLLVVGYVVFSTTSGAGNRLSFAVVSVATLMLALRTSRVNPRWYGLAITASIIALAVVAIDVSPLETGRGLEAAATVSAAVLLLGAPAAILQRILGHRRVSIETILGAVCVYLLIGFIFAAGYGTIDALTEGSFFAERAAADVEFGAVSSQDADRDELLYYSFTVLTTLGFGDLTAAGQFGRSISVLEAVIGQIFLVTLVARLVGLFGMPARQGPVRED